MSPVELALRYMEKFYSGEHIERLRPLLKDDFTFNGPWFTFDSAESYIGSLLSDPPVECNYEIIKTFENSTSACIFYMFSKPGVSVSMAQMFEIRDEKICSSLLIFDTGAFT